MAIKQVCAVNPHFDNYENVMGLLGNIWLQQGILFETVPKSELTKFTENVSNTLCIPRIKRWFKKTTRKRPDLTYDMLNTYKQAYLLATGSIRKRGETAKMAAANYDDFNECDLE